MDQIIKLQKKAVRIISGSAYNPHSEPLFKILRLLKLQDIHALQRHKFIYQLINKDLPSYFHSMLTIVAVNFHQRWVFFADFSVNSKSISMKFCKHSFQLFRRLPWKFREIWMSISKVRPFDM